MADPDMRLPSPLTDTDSPDSPDRSKSPALESELKRTISKFYLKNAFSLEKH